MQKLHISDPYTAIAYFYFTFSDVQKQNTENMLRSLIVQLCGRRTDTPQLLLDLRAFRDMNHQPDLDDLQVTLQACVKDFKDVYLIIDANDH